MEISFLKRVLTSSSFEYIFFFFQVFLCLSGGNQVGNADSSCKELVDLKGKGQFSNEPNCTPEVFMPSPKVDSVRAADRVPLGGSIAGRSLEVDSFKEAEKSKIEDRNCQTSELSLISDEGKHLLASRKPEAEMQSQENVEFQQRTSGVI